jgi:hypothetical protein
MKLNTRGTQVMMMMMMIKLQANVGEVGPNTVKYSFM